jgi:hypothetical protein
MRVPIIVLAAAAVALGSTASADPYKDFAAQGYRWVAVDGPYACPSKDDLQEITRHRTDLLEAKMVSDLRAYYLIRGVIVQVLQEDAASGMSEVHLPGGFKTFWTLKRFLSRKSHQRYFRSGGNAHNVEYDACWTNDAQPTPKADADALNQQHAMPIAGPK